MAPPVALDLGTVDGTGGALDDGGKFVVKFIVWLVIVVVVFVGVGLLLLVLGFRRGRSCLLLGLSVLVVHVMVSDAAARATGSTGRNLRPHSRRCRGFPKQPGRRTGTSQWCTVCLVQLDGDLGRDGTHGRTLRAVAGIALGVGGIVVLGIGPNSAAVLAAAAVEGGGPVQR